MIWLLALWFIMPFFVQTESMTYLTRSLHE